MIFVVSIAEHNRFVEVINSNFMRHKNIEMYHNISLKIIRNELNIHVDYILSRDIDFSSVNYKVFGTAYSPVHTLLLFASMFVIRA